MIPLSLEAARNLLYRRKTTPPQRGTREFAEELWINYCYAPKINQARHGEMCRRVWEAQV